MYLVAHPVACAPVAFVQLPVSSYLCPAITRSLMSSWCSAQSSILSGGATALRFSVYYRIVTGYDGRRLCAMTGCNDGESCCYRWIGHTVVSVTTVSPFCGPEGVVSALTDYSCGPALTRDAPSGVSVNCTKFLIKRSASFSAFSCHSLTLSYVSRGSSI